MTGLRTDEHGTTRCWWCGDDPLYMRYHDEEWGRPVRDDRLLFEHLVLDAFQCGLSWITILRKRENFRKAFADFDMKRVAKFTTRDVQRLLRDEGIIRHRGKIEAAIHNARGALAIIEECGSLAEHLWRFSPDSNRRRVPGTSADIPPLTPESEALSKELRRRGWKFVGPTTIYAFMQAAGLVNDHLRGCHVRESIPTPGTKIPQRGKH